MSTLDNLPFELVEELKVKNLLPFVVGEQSSCNFIILSVYENQKYCRVIKEWGSIIGVHLFSKVDRGVWSNDDGKHTLSCSLENVSPLNGFKWKGDWTLVVDKTTDENGFQYARNWYNLRDVRHPSSCETTFSQVRRRKWNRKMIINLDTVKRALPYELCARISVIPLNNANNNALASQYVELFVQGKLMDSGILSLPHFLKGFFIPLTHLNASQRYEIVVSKSTSQQNNTNTTTTNTSNNKHCQKTRHHWLLGNILKEISVNKFNQYECTIVQEKTYQITIEWKLIENTLFRVNNLQSGSLHLTSLPSTDTPTTMTTTVPTTTTTRTNESAADNTMKLSQQLKERIIVLSLSLQEENECSSLLQEITNLMMIYDEYITDMDIITMLEDVNRMILQKQQSNGTNMNGMLGSLSSNIFDNHSNTQYDNNSNKFSKVISFLKEADEEIFTQKRNALSYVLLYPAIMPVFSCHVPITTMTTLAQEYDQLQELSESHIGIMHWDRKNPSRQAQITSILTSEYQYNQFYCHQPIALSTMRTMYNYNWQCEHNLYIPLNLLNSSSSSSAYTSSDSNTSSSSSSSAAANSTNASASQATTAAGKNVAGKAVKTGGRYKKNMYYIKLLLIGEEEISLDFYWKNMIDYLIMLKILSIMKAMMIDDVLHPEDEYGNRNNGSSLHQAIGNRNHKEELSVHGILIIEDRVYNNGIITLNPLDRCLDLSYESTGKEEFYRHGHLPILPWHLNFQYIEGVILSHSFALSTQSMMEIKLLSLTSFSLPQPSPSASTTAMYGEQQEYGCKLDISTKFGQHYCHEFRIQSEGYQQPATAVIDETIRLFLPPAELYPSANPKNSTSSSPSTTPFVNISLSIDPNPIPCASSTMSRAYSSTSFSSSMTRPTSFSTMNRTNSVTSSTLSSSSSKRESKRFSMATPDSSSNNSTSHNAHGDHANLKGYHPSGQGFVSIPTALYDTNHQSSSAANNNNNATKSLFSQHNSEEELQIVISKKMIIGRIDYRRITWWNTTVESLVEDQQIYMLTYLVDREMRVLSLSSQSNSQGGASSPSRSKRSSLSLGLSSSSSSSSSTNNATNATNALCVKRSGHLHRSRMINGEVKYDWTPPRASKNTSEGEEANENDEDEDGEVVIIDSHHHPFVDQAAYILVEVYSTLSATSSTSFSSQLLGEVLIPFPYATDAQQGRNKEEIHTIRQVVTHDSSGNPHFPSTPQFVLGQLYLTMQVNFTPLPAPFDNNPMPMPSSSPFLSQRQQQQRMSSNLLKISTRYQPIHTSDCYWPAYILNHTEKTLDVVTYYLHIANDGIHIRVFPDHTVMNMYNSHGSANTVHVNGGNSSGNGGGGHNERMHSDRMTVLEECVERISAPNSASLHMLLPYPQVSLHQIHVLNTHMMLCNFTFKRLLPATSTPAGSGGNTTNNTATASSTASTTTASGNALKYREITMEFLIGPCLADDIYATISNRVMLLPLRQQLIQHIVQTANTNTNFNPNTMAMTTTNPVQQQQIKAYQELEQSFNKLVKLFQEQIYETVCLVESYPASSHKKNNANNTNAIVNKQQMNQEKWMIDFEKYLSYHSNNNNNNNVSLSPYHSSDYLYNKLGFLKISTLKIFLWYLIIQAPSNFLAEKYFMEANWLLQLAEHEDNNQQLLLANNNNTNDDDTGKKAVVVVDIDNLLARIQSTMQTTEDTIRQLMLRSIRFHQEDISFTLSKFIYEKYISTITMLLDAMESLNTSDSNNTTAATTTMTTANKLQQNIMLNNPQKKRDFIKYIILNDSIFEDYLLPMLRSHNYGFSLRPLLSLCIDYTTLLNEFSNVLDESLYMWNMRTLAYFRNSLILNNNNNNNNSNSNHGTGGGGTNGVAGKGQMRESIIGNSNGILPWEITLMKDKDSGYDLYCSNIPETIQMQLNVEIGLKKITPSIFHQQQIKLSSAGTKDSNEKERIFWYRIDLMNSKIALAIARSYVTLASEYERIVISGASLFTSSLLNTDHSDDLICFFLSILNDCYRMMYIHIPSSIKLFATHRESNTNNGEGEEEEVLDLASLLKNDLHGDGNISFTTSLKAMNSVTRYTINELSNQLFFHVELLGYFIHGFDEYMGFAPSKKKPSSSSSATNNNTRSSFLATSRKSLVAHCDTNEDHSSVQIIVATMIEFLTYIQEHIHIEDVEKVYYLCFLKFIIRYFLILRDYHHYHKTLLIHNHKSKTFKMKKPYQLAARRSFVEHPHHHTAEEEEEYHAYRSTSDDDITGRRGGEEEVIIDPLKHDYRNIMTFHQQMLKELRLPDRSHEEEERKKQHQPHNHHYDHTAKHPYEHGTDCCHDHDHQEEEEEDSISSNEEELPEEREGEEEDFDQLHLHQSSKQHNKSQHNNSKNQKKKPVKIRTEDIYKHTLHILIQHLQYCHMLYTTDDWLGPQVINEFLATYFHMTPPNPPSNTSWSEYQKYLQQLEQFFRQDSNFIQFIPSKRLIEQTLQYDVTKKVSFVPVTATSHVTTIPASISQTTCTLHIYNLACVQVRKYHNVFMKFYIHDDIHKTTIASYNNLQMSCWPDRIELIGLPVNACKMLKVELYGFRLRTMKMRRERYIGYFTLNLMDLLKSETSNNAAASIQTASLLSASSNNNSNNHSSVMPPELSHLQPSDQETARHSSSESTAIVKQLQSSMDKQGRNATEGFVHTAWYVVQPTRYYLLTGGIVGKNANHHANSLNNANLASFASTQSYVTAFSSRKPHEDTLLPQVQLTLQILLV